MKMMKMKTINYEEGIMNNIKPDDVIYEVCYLDDYTFDDENTYEYLSKDINAKIGDVILIAPKGVPVIKNNQKQFTLQFALITNISKPNFFENYKRPLYIASIDLSEYFQTISNIIKKDFIKKKMDEAIKELDTLQKYKLLASMNENFKSLYDEYMKLTTNNMLDSN